MSKPNFNIDKKLLQAAGTAIEESLAVEKGERVLIVTNPSRDVHRISQALYSASIEVGASPALMVQPMKTTFDFAEPSVINAIKSEPEVLISISADRLGKDKQALAKPYKGSDGKTFDHIFTYLLRGAKKIRSFWSPRIKVDTFTRAVPISYSAVQETSAKVAERMKNADKIHVKTELGTNIEFGVEGREPMTDDGNFKTAGKGGNLPCGEVFISPALGTANGEIVFDGSIGLEKTLIIKEPLRVFVKNGFVTEISGGKAAKKLGAHIAKAERKPIEMSKYGEMTQKKADEYVRNARNIGEFGIGLNPKANIVGLVLEDEKVLGTIHFAIGSNYDQDALALIHSDGIVKNPTVAIDGNLIMEKGRLII